MKRTRKSLPEPEKPKHIPESVQWLSGEGAGSWFYLLPKPEESQLVMQRFSPSGKLECEGIFKPKSDCPNLQNPIAVTHLSHCQQLSIEQHGKVFLFVRVE
ncbi:MAG: DUF6695 family protein [Flavobacteriaceae bacterium]|nr:DUF6695 family protein [Flavobacteriaceae bacterium]